MSRIWLSFCKNKLILPDRTLIYGHSWLCRFDIGIWSLAVTFFVFKGFLLFWALRVPYFDMFVLILYKYSSWCQWFASKPESLSILYYTYWSPRKNYLMFKQVRYYRHNLIYKLHCKNYWNLLESGDEEIGEGEESLGWPGSGVDKINIGFAPCLLSLLRKERKLIFTAAWVPDRGSLWASH